jgi:phage protein|nr:MAG TPA: Protein of unknown function (DUF1642) [Caudoviricetes sp.]
MNVQELIEKYKKYEDALFDIGAKVACQKILQDLEQLDEPEKIKVPQFVAEIIEYYKKQNATLYDALREKNFNKQYSEWLLNKLDAYDKVARAWLDGYEVEKENQYVVTLKNGQPLVKSQPGSTLYFSQDVTAGNYKVTRKELEEAGFGWVFDCEGVEVQEVE